jgi:hypothetical protein
VGEPARTDDAIASQEIQLLEYAERLARNRDGRVAMHIHLSRLRAWNRREQHLRVATSTFADLVRSLDGQGFVLRNSDIVFIGHARDIDALNDVVDRLRGMFNDDQATSWLPEVADQDAFCTWIGMSQKYDEFHAWVRQVADAERARQRRVAAARAGAAGPTRRPIDPVQLGRIEAYLSQADLSGLIRRQPVCILAPDQPPKPVLRELYIAIADLAAAVTPDVDLSGNRWLFRHLTRVLDQRMLSMLSRNDDKELAAAFTINLNVETISTPQFLAFDKTIGSQARGTIVIEFDLIDAIGDMSGYIFAREVVRERGYRVCIDGVDHLNFPMVDRERLGADFIKLNWKPEYTDLTNAQQLNELRQNIQRAGAPRVILTRCNEAAAIPFGQSLAISLYQGRHIDQVYAESQRKNGGAPVRAKAS